VVGEHKRDVGACNAVGDVGVRVCSVVRNDGGGSRCYDTAARRVLDAGRHRWVQCVWCVVYV